MANFLFSQMYVQLSDEMISTQFEAIPNYPKVNIADWWELPKVFVNSNANSGTWLLRIDFGANTPLSALVINNTNIGAVTVQKSTDDTTYTDVGTFDIPLDYRVLRRKCFIYLNDFNHRYLRLFIPSGESPTDSIPFWWISSVVPVIAYFEAPINPKYGYQFTASRPFVEVPKGSGSVYRINTAPARVWSCTMNFLMRNDSSASNFLGNLSSLSPAAPTIFYENLGDSSKVYICVINDSISTTWDASSIYHIESIRLKELV